MISERKFAEKLTSFWHEALPRSKKVMTTLNLQRIRFAPPLASEVHAKRRALVNEIGFHLFTRRIRDGRIADDAADPAVAADVGRQLEGELAAELPLPDAGQISGPSDAEIQEAVRIAARLSLFFREHVTDAPLVAAPEFAGCGIVETCRGDVLAGETLYEVKSGESNFGAHDLRQVLTYCALNHALPRYMIRAVGLVNPRLGLFFESDLESLVRGAAGLSADGLFFEMTRFLSSESASV